MESLEPRIVLTLNTPPIAVADSIEVVEDQAYVAAPRGVLANDTDADDDALAAILVSGPAHGTLKLNPNGSFRYVPEAGYSGPDAFVYRARDNFASSEPATVTIDVAPVNDPPTAVDNFFSLAEDGVLESPENILANDTDPEEDSLTAELLADPVNGTLTLQPSGLFTYTPNPDFFGEDWFSYRAVDGAGATSQPATVTITVNPVNDAPLAASDVSYQTNEDTLLSIEAEGVLFNDFDADFDPLSASVIDDVTHGTLELAPNGGFTYTPDAGYSGLDSFTYAASDGAGGTSTAVVLITIHPVNDAPEFDSNVDPEPDPELDQFVFSVDENSPAGTAVGTVVALDSDLLDELAYAITAGNEAGFFAIDPASGLITLTALASLDFETAEPFVLTVQVTDLTSLTDTAQVTILVADLLENEAPIAVDDDATAGYAVDEDQVLNVPAELGVLENDTDPNGDPLTATLVSQAAHGVVALNPDGSFTYTPDANYHGPDSFTYQASDDLLDSNIATVTITVNPVNDNPVAADNTTTTDEDTPVTIDVLTGDSDLDGDTLTVTAITQPANGAAAINPDSTITYTPNPNFHGADSFTYTLGDGNGGTSIATVTITVNSVNDAPVADDDSATTDEDTPVIIDVLTGDTDVDGDSLTVTAITQPASGASAINEGGTITYTPNPNFHGDDSFTYTIGDGNGGTATGTVNITVNSVLDPIVANDDEYNLNEDEYGSSD